MKDADTEDEAKILGHFSDALQEMAASIMNLVDGYFKALHEVIIEMERALRDVSRIDAHYVSQVVTVMTSWQEAVQTTASHMEGIDTTMYLALCEDTRKATKVYVEAVVKAQEECDMAHAVEQEAQKQAIKANDFENPVVRLLQSEKAVEAFLPSIKATLQKHMPVHAQGPLISNALSTAFQFQMSMWCMIGEECIHPIRALRLVRPGWHHPSHSRDVPKELCSDVSSGPASGGFILYHLQATVV